MAQTQPVSEVRVEILQLEKIAGIFLPPQPQILVDLQMEQVMPDPSAQEIARLINTDPGLAASVLKAANLYARPDRDNPPYLSVFLAVDALGIEAVLNIVNGIAIRGELQDEQIQQLNVFWDTASDVAKASALIADRLGEPQPDRCYLLGLFHNCGMAILMRDRPEYPEVVRKAYNGQGKRIIDVENECLKTNHAVLGYYTAKSWHVAQPLCDVIADHHSAQCIFTDPVGSYCPDKKNLLAILKLAENLCRVHERVGHCDQDREWAMVEKPVLEHLGLSDYDYQALQDLVQDQL